MKGFFSSEMVSGNTPSSGVPKCGACGLYRHCKSPKMKPTGKGLKRILIVAESPGEKEDEEGIQLIGKSGQELRKHLRQLGVDLDRDCWKTNAVICHPDKNESPTDDQIDSCRPVLNATIKVLNPEVIILLGGAAVKSLIGNLWRANEDPGAISRWVGWSIPSQQLNAWVCPTYHPAYLLRQNDPVLSRWFHTHLEHALSHKTRPWTDGVPDYEGQVGIVHDPNEAARIIRKMTEKGGRVAFDYETNMLKPDSSSARIHSCSVCWEGKKTIAYPWFGEAVQATSEMLLSDRIEKIGWNIKFEQRWTKAVLQHGVKNWVWDGMLATHVLDNRPGICSAKFQAFVRLGLPAYDAAIKPYLESGGTNTKNRIREADLSSLLLYNGLDSIVEFAIGVEQMKEMGSG